MLAGDADRDRAANVLKEAFAEGRLTQDEYEERIGLTYQARTYAELDVITQDIPRPGPPMPAPQPPYRSQPQPYRWVPPPSTNGKAIASLVLSLMGWPVCGLGSIAGVVLGHLAKGEIQERGERGEGLAKAGLVLGYLGIGLWLLVFLTGSFGG